MTPLVLLGSCAVILSAASIFIVGVAVGFGIARRRYCPPKRQATVIYRLGGAEVERFSVPLSKGRDLL